MAAFITIYKAATRRATNKQKRVYIINCLGAIAQEVIVPKLPAIHTWAQMRELLIQSNLNNTASNNMLEAVIRRKNAATGFKPATS